jgi:hypothetical protein
MESDSPFFFPTAAFPTATLPNVGAYDWLSGVQYEWRKFASGAN